MTKVQFKQISSTQTKFDFKGHTFLLNEQDRGFFGAGRSVALYQLDGVKKTFVVSVGWLRGDSQPSFRDDLIKQITDMNTIKKEAVNYLEKLLG